MIRIPAARGAATRIEVRSVDPSANPYLAMSGILAAGLDGIKSDLKSISPVKKNLFRMSLLELKRHGIKNLPENLKEAIDEFSVSPLMKETIGDILFDKLIEAKTSEWSDYKTKVTQFELDRYLPII
jgi:glutamine synthetase